MRFSQRIGRSKIKFEVQLESMDKDLRNGLWNCLQELYWDRMLSSNLNYHRSYEETIVRHLWKDHFKERLDTIPFGVHAIVANLRQRFDNCSPFEVYDLVEFIPQVDPDTSRAPYFRNYCNKILERELSAFRFVGTLLTRMTEQAEIEAIDKALTLRDNWSVVSAHVATALARFNDRKNPDYRNSIKESISAVESAACIFVGSRATLGDALKLIEKNHGLQAALKDGFLKLYGYTSDSNGIRHALMEESNLMQEDALFMLIACSAFVNYLKSKF